LLVVVVILDESYAIDPEKGEWRMEDGGRASEVP
jgi:hypothetical protein